MSGFSADWLALREPADHAARNGDVLADVARHVAGRDHLSIIDLGCGAGSNLRGFALSLPARRQSWTLIDYDAALLKAARERLIAWADETEELGEELLIEKSGKTLTIDFRQADLNADMERIAGWRPDLVTAAALFDLVSPAWIDRFAAALARWKLPLYTVLVYDGREQWTPPHPLDAAIHDAFLAHQRRDKGFGPSAGPDAARLMEAAFSKQNYRVASGESPWRLGVEDAALIAQLAGGVASAAAETGLPAADVEQWRAFRETAARAPGASARVGHRDLFTAP
ncbi:MAG: hypothetical protein BGP06_17965 [Rhizobiales bacterium 65-9]|nr:class I SAM-dependent methyltransferase [Hyphomicrobiales bacterium]OJY34729.1 MAG: hypothetical protein BGP06_17965 [Rhizobiales bacterium 65-9]